MKHLKLFFALFAMLALGVGNAWGADVTFDATKDKGSTSTGAVSFEKDGITLSAENGALGNGTDYRIYKNTKLTISSSVGTITNISFTFKSTSYDGGGWSASYQPNAAKWTSPVANGEQARITKIVVTYTPSTGGGETPGEGGGEDPETPGAGGSGNIVIKYNSTFTPTLPSAKASVNTSSTAHTVEGLNIYEQGIYKGSSNNYLMFVENKGFLYNTQSLGTITSVSVTYTSGTSTSGKAGVYFGSTEQNTYTNTSNQTIAGQSKTDTWTNTTEGNGFFQLSTSSKNVQITQIEITYTSGSDEGGGEETVPSLTQDQFSWSATTATATLPNTFDNQPTLKNTENLTVSYSSSNGEVAIIGENGNVTLVGKGETIISATAGDDETYKKTTVSYTLTVKPAPLAPIAGGVIDILNQGWTGVTGTNYTDVAAKTAENEGHSNAQYVAQCAGDKSSIQLRSNNNNSGVVSTVSGGVVKRVEVEWNDGTDAARTLQIYGSNTAYTAATDLYGDAKGEFLGELNKGEGETTLDFSEWTGDYKYIGFRSKSGAMYLTTITITWLPINSKVTIDDAIQNGSISVSGAADLNAVAAGTVLTLDNTPEAGYKFVKYNVYKTDEPTTEIDVENSKFTMPEYDVTVSATFTSIKELDKIEVNTTNVKKTFWQGEAFSSNGLEVTAYYTDGTSSEVTPTNITGGNTANAGEITVTVSYTEGSNTKTTTYNITVKAIENNETTVYTVAQAREIIDAVGNTTVEVYVQGIVSKIVTAFNPTYGNISYDISADGLKTSDQLQAYRGFSYDGAWFTSADDIQVGDVVVVKGKLKIYNTTYELDEGNKLVSLVRSTEPKPTAATLPFEFDGNKDDIADVVGMSHEGLGNYNTSPKLKFDDANDNVIIHFDSEPGEFSFALKQNGQNAGTFTVYESENGEDYTSVWSGGNLGNGQTSTIESNLSSTARYVKFELTTKGNSTNYGLGQISIKKIDKRQDTGIAWNPATISLTVGDAFTAPDFTNPNNVTGIEFTSSNTELATVTNAGVISLVSGKTGTATITATFADGDATYKPAEVTCVITVNPKSEKVVILAQLEGQWYAMTGKYVSGKTNVLAAIPVEYINGTLYNVAETDIASIEWQRSMNGNKATFKNGDNYLTGGTSTDLTLKTDAFEWDYNGVNYLCNDGKRTFLYCENTKTNVYGFKNYAISNAGSVKNNNDGTTESYSSTPEVVAPVYATATIYTRSVTSGNFGTICLPYGSSNYSGAEFFEVAGKETGKVTLNSVKTLVAGTPYIFQATDSKISVVYEGEAAETALVDNGLHGTFEKIDDVETTSAGKGYIIALMPDGTCALQLCGANCWLDPNRAYLVIEEINKTKSPMPGCRRISMDVQGENVETGVEDLFSTDAPVKLIENGQLIIIRDGVKYNIQGQRL